MAFGVWRGRDGIGGIEVDGRSWLTLALLMDVAGLCVMLELVGLWSMGEELGWVWNLV